MFLGYCSLFQSQFFYPVSTVLPVYDAEFLRGLGTSFFHVYLCSSKEGGIEGGREKGGGEREREGREKTLIVIVFV